MKFEVHGSADGGYGNVDSNAGYGVGGGQGRVCAQVEKFQGAGLSGDVADD